MDIRRLQAFVAVADQGNFGRAAQLLSTTQPALTKQIQTLERETGTVLFIRGRQGTVLTAAGQTLLADSADLVRRADALEQRMKRVAGGSAGLLSVGFGMSSINIAPRAVAAFRVAHPSIDVTLEDMSSSAQIAALRERRLSVGFIRHPVPADIATRVISRDQLALAIPHGETLPQLDRESVRSWLDGRPLIRLVPARGPGLAAQTEELFVDVGCRSATLQETSDLLTVLALVSAGVGAALVPASVSAIVPEGVNLLPIDLASARWSIGVAWRRDSTDPLIPRFLQAAGHPETHGNDTTSRRVAARLARPNHAS